MKRKRIILIAIIIIILLSAVYFAYSKGYIFKLQDYSNNENEQSIKDVNQTNINNEIKENEKVVYIEGTKMVNDIEITNIQIKLIEKKKCELIANVKNTTNQYKEVTNLCIKVIGASGEVDEIFGGGITELAAYEPNILKTYALADITDAKDIIFEVID